MDLMETIYQRRSVRTFSTQPVEKTTIETLLKATVQAPSAMNSQPWSFVIMENQQLLKECSDQAKAFLLSHLDQRPLLQKYQSTLANPAFQIFYNAPTVIVIYGNPESPHVVEDCSLAAQTLMLAAHGMGLGTCWIGFATPLLNSIDWKEKVAAPSEYIAIAPIVVGYPKTELQQLEKKPPHILSWN